MIKRKELENYLNTYLNIKDFSDYGPNGIQIEGKEVISRIAFAVSATKDSVQQSVAWKADALIVHHGVFWHQVRTITGPYALRVKPLIQNEISLFAYHLPLDAHPDSGNAAVIAGKLGMKKLEGFGDHKRMPIGVKGSIAPISVTDLEKKLSSILSHPVIVASENPKAKITSIGIITGGASSRWNSSVEANLDAFITGEVHEYDWHDAKEAGIHFFAGGHHATERFGVLALKEILEKKFKVKTIFFDSENPA